MRQVTLRSVSFAAALLVFGAAPARADKGQDEARELAVKGFSDYKAGKFDDAIGKLQKAEAKFHAPTHLLYIARCQDKLGKWRAARDTYRDLLAETLDAKAPQAYRDAQTDARLELNALELRMPRLRFFSKGQVVSILVDGRPLSAAERNERILLDPGKHEVEAEIAARKVTRSVDLGPGSDQMIDLDESGMKGGGGTERKEGSLVPGIVLAGIGAAGLGVGIGVGVASLDKVSVLNQQCPNKQCTDPGLISVRDQAQTLGHVSTAMFVVGGVAAAAGIVLIAVRPGGSSVKVSATPMGFNVSGSFR